MFELFKFFILIVSVKTEWGFYLRNTNVSRKYVFFVVVGKT